MPILVAIKVLYKFPADSVCCWVSAEDLPDDFFEFTAADYAAIQATKKEGKHFHLCAVLHGCFRKMF